MQGSYSRAQHVSMKYDGPLPSPAEIVEMTEGTFDFHFAANRQRLQILAHLASIWESGVLILPVHLQ